MADMDEDELDKLLSGYNQSLNISDKEVDESEEEQEQETENNSDIKISPPETVLENVPESVWRGNSNYYQSGKKQGKPKPKALNKQPKQDLSISGSLIDGALFLMLVDILFPLIITAANNSFTKSPIDVEELQMTQRQKDDLKPVADEVVKYLTLQANPVWLMVIAMSGIYGINFMAAKVKHKK